MKIDKNNNKKKLILLYISCGFFIYLLWKITKINNKFI